MLQLNKISLILLLLLTPIVAIPSSKSMTVTTTPNTLISTSKIHTPKIAVTGLIKQRDMLPLVSEVTGKIIDLNNTFIPGKALKKGTIIVKINDDQIRYNYYAQKSTFIKSITQLIAEFRIQFPSRVNAWERFLRQYSIKKPLPPLPSASRSKETRYLSAKNIYNQYYSLKQLESRLDTYTIRAPFDGTISTPKVKHNDLVVPGHPLGRFIGKGNYELTLSLPSQKGKLIQKGNRITCKHPQLKRPIITTLSSLDTHIEPKTQTILAYCEFPNPKTIDGYLVECTIEGNPIFNSHLIPRKYIQNNHVTHFSNNTFTKQAITLHHTQQDHALISGTKQNLSLVLPND